MNVGSADRERAVRALETCLPEPLRALARIAYNYRWSWTPGGPELWAAIDPARWEICAGNPVRMLQEVHPERLEALARDEGFLRRLDELEQELHRALGAPLPAGDEHPAAFFCAEYAVHRSLPVYSGGLGVLAGDILKEASDMGLPLVAVGLMYRHGYFRQRIDASGWQHEYWVDTDPDRVPAVLVRDNDGEPLTVTVPVGRRELVAQVWRVDVGRVPLLLLDADRPENGPVERWITSRLYVGDADIRLAQYALLGIGGARALEALGVEPGVVHLNEGHAALACVELARQERARHGCSVDEAFEAVRRRTVFTTHTPVPAGNDSYPADRIADALAGIAAELGADPDYLVRRGRTHPDEAAEPFGVTQFALRSSRVANAVSARHGEVAREMWHDLWPDRPVQEVPITHVTNGVHIPTWLGCPMRELLDRHLGEGWEERATDPATWAPVDDIPAQELWAARTQQRRELIELARERSVMERLGRGDTGDYVRAAAETLDPEALTLGFARRVATYKRLDLLLRDVDRALALLGDPERPVQFLLAGKAHPRDDPGKRLIQHLFSMKPHRQVAGRVLYLDDYDLALGAAMVRGCDVWVNVPRPPLEASGTSGIKSAMNGGLQLSVLDGWWPEAYDGSNGWAIAGEVDHDHGAQDWRHADQLYRLMLEETVPRFYDRGEDGIPHAWLAMVRSSLRTIGPRFGAGRMVRDYAGRIYASAVGAPA